MKGIKDLLDSFKKTFFRFKRKEEKEVEKIKKNIKDHNKDSHKFDPLGYKEFMAFQTSSWKVFWYNFLAGIGRGFGLVFGMTVVVALATLIVSYLIDVPLIGEFFVWLKSAMGQAGESIRESASVVK